MEDKRKAFPAWLKDFRRKYDFATCVITPNYRNMLIEAFLLGEEENRIDEIYCWIEADKYDMIRAGQDEERLSFHEDEEDKDIHQDKWLNGDGKDDIKNLIKSWFKLNKTMMTPDDLRFLIECAQQELVEKLN
jgi:hypothetical protein